MIQRKNTYYIGIDPGTHTGLCLYASRSGLIKELHTVPIHTAISLVEQWYNAVKAQENAEMLVVFEDARQRKWYGVGNTSAKLQGAGSVKRDCSIWEDFLRDKDIPFRAVPPVVGGTKMDAKKFALLTHYQGKCSEHARDAAMLVFGH